jgi:tetratricopeptide (TPR) repeat protein
VYLDLRTKVFDDFDKGLVFYEMIKSEEKDKYDLSNLPNDLYNTAKYLMRRSRYDDAIKILHLSTLEDLTNKGGMSYAFMLIGQCYQNKGEKKLSEVYYSKSVELDPTNKNAQGMLDEIRKENRPAN